MIGAVQCKTSDNHFDRILSPQYSNQIAGHSYFDAAQATSRHTRSLVYRVVDDDQNRKGMMIGAVQCRILSIIVTVFYLLNIARGLVIPFWM